MGFGALGNGTAEATAPAQWTPGAGASPPFRSTLHGRVQNDMGSDMGFEEEEEKRDEAGWIWLNPDAGSF